MYIVDYQRMNVVNMDNISNLSLEGRQIVAYDTSGHRNQLGIYDNKRAIEVFTNILDMCFPPSVRMMKDPVDGEDIKSVPGYRFALCSSGNVEFQTTDNGTYYMPEK